MCILPGLCGMMQRMGRNRIVATIGLLLLCATAMGAECVSAPFRVVHHPKDATCAQRSLDVLTAALAEFGGRLPAGEDAIEVRIAHTMTEFLQQAGHFSMLAVAGVARPEESVIVVKAPHLRKLNEDYAGTLRHELVHILLYRNTETHRNLPRWLNEGIAMMLANEHRWNSMFRVARMFFQNRIIDYQNLDNAFLAPGNEMAFGDAYAQALSMTRYLYDSLGEERFWEVIRGCRSHSFSRALLLYGGVELTDYWNLYHHSLWRIALIAMLSSGTLFTPGALLLILAYWRKRRSNKRILQRWALEEAAGRETAYFSWDDVVEGPEAWKGDGYDPEE